jgi:VCBS repeat-containing protein
VVVGFRDESGNTLSSPSFNVSGSQRTETNKTLLSSTAYASSNIQDALQPDLEIHAPPGDYNLSNIRFRAADGTNLTFPGFPITFECGVRKGVPISGKPEILVAQPPAYFLTNAESVTVSGTAADDNGIASMTVNGNPVGFTVTGNLDNEVSFNHDLSLPNGDNIVVTAATDLDGNESFDERPVYVDRWQPLVNIETPADGEVFADPTATVTIDVLGSDQGYGFTIELYYDGNLISEASGPANQTAAESITLSETIGPMAVGAHTLLAEITDAAGNNASHSITISTNTIPVATDDAYTTLEDVPLNVAAPGVLGNDTDADGHSLSATTSVQPNHGSLTLNPNGSFSYVPNLNFNGSDSFTYTIDDGFGGSDTATVTLSITPVNDPPVANNDSYSTDEDVPLTVSALDGVLANDVDVEGDALTGSLVAGPTNGTLALNSDGSFGYTPDQDFNGTDSFSYRANDATLQSNTATVTITVKPVNDAPVVGINITSQSVQYSDLITPVNITAYDIDSPQLDISSIGELPLGVSIASGSGCIAVDAGSSCSWALEGPALEGVGSYAITLAVSDNEYVPSPQVDTALTVTLEDATVELDNIGNPTSVMVAHDGGTTGPFSMTVYVSETLPDLPVESAAPGDIAKANVDMSLIALGSGASVGPSSCDSSTIGVGYDAVQEVTCTFDQVDVEIYALAVAMTGDFYQGGTEGVLVVYDPSLGFTTGGGWFYWPDTNDKTNFGYTMKYGNNGNSVKGNLLLIRHLADGDKYRIKSNVISNLAVGVDPTGAFGWAWFDGKSTYLEPGMPEAEGNHGFTVYSEDHDEPGSGVDRIWLKVEDKDGIPIDAMSMSEPAPAHATAIEGGNIAVPH